MSIFRQKKGGISSKEYSMQITEPSFHFQPLNDCDKYLRIEEQLTGFRFNRIHFGSHFCSQFFCHSELELLFNRIAEYVSKNALRMTLCVPVLNERLLNEGKQVITNLALRAEVDEITVNDVAMLDYVVSNDEFDKCKVNLGRLFFKDTRDFRYPEDHEMKQCPSETQLLVDSLREYLPRIYMVELDPVPSYRSLKDYLPASLKVALHQPYCFQTTGQICMYASSFAKATQKFRPNMLCHLECCQMKETYKSAAGTVFRAGRTVFFESNAKAKWFNEADRIIWSDYEYSSTLKQ